MTATAYVSIFSSQSHPVSRAHDIALFRAVVLLASYLGPICCLPRSSDRYAAGLVGMPRRATERQGEARGVYCRRIYCRNRYCRQPAIIFTAAAAAAAGEATRLPI